MNEIATRVMQAAFALNEAITAAEEAGLSVEVDVTSTQFQPGKRKAVILVGCHPEQNHNEP